MAAVLGKVRGLPSMCHAQGTVLALRSPVPSLGDRRGVVLAGTAKLPTEAGPAGPG